MRQGIIAAISTPPGKGGVAIIRTSGKGSRALAEEIFFPRSGKALSSYPARMQVYGYIKDNGEVVDDGLVTVFGEGSSYTGEETVEYSVHGGILVTRRVLELIFSHGAIPATAGEFTRTAFINGKLGLIEAEAIGDLLEAKSNEQLKLASGPARERLRGKVEGMYNSIVRLLGSVYARIDYPEEDLGEFTDDELLSGLSAVREELASLIATYRTGRAIREGISTVLVGKPNVGKSTLYNLLLGEDAAIVTDIPGTTRDILERTVPLGRVMLSLCDTAGVHTEGVTDEVELIGIRRTKERIEAAELVLALFDLSRPADEADREVIEAVRGATGAKIAILTKADSKGDGFAELLDGFDSKIEISALSAPEAALEAIRSEVEALFTDEKISTSSDAIVASARQHAALVSALGFIDEAIGAIRLGIPADAASSDIELCLGALAEVDGRAVSEDVVSDIFARFCVGK